MKRWTAKEMTQVLKYKADGLSSKEIAKKIGRTQTSVQVKLSNLKKANKKPVAKAVKRKAHIPISFPTEADAKPFFSDRKISKRYIVLSAATVALIAAVVIESLM